MSINLIELKNVVKTFFLESGREFTALNNINLCLKEGEVLALLGPSGSGKSTCLRIMCGLHQATTGEVLQKGHPLTDINLDVAMVFQNFALLPWETVHRNIFLALESVEMTSHQKNELVKKVIDIVGLEGFEEAYPRELSGGMKQRVGLARAMAMQRSILFLDEPFSALDVLTSETLRQEILKIYYNKQTTIKSMVLVTHNIQEAVLMADRILVLGSNPGHIRQEFTNPMPYPRNEDSYSFKDLVTKIHQCITESYMPDTPEAHDINQSAMQKNAKIQIEILPPVTLIEVIGLIEAIAGEGGQVDLFSISNELGLEFGKMLYLVKAAELLDLVETPKQKVFLTSEGLSFINSDINKRKSMLNAAFKELNIVKVVDHFLKETGIIRLPVQELIEKIQPLIPNEDAHAVINVLIGWGRYAEYYGYNDDTKTIYLDVGQDYQH